ncbi:MAG: hypothetical protein PHY82_09815 [Lentisphaeria bacterium]|nr:hypothetical protein [Lentisphaeria bacterium]
MKNQCWYRTGLILMAVFWGISGSFAAAEEALLREAQRQLAGKVEKSLAASGLSGQGALALLPLPGDDAAGSMAGLVKNAAVRSGIKVVEHSDQPMFEKLLAEASQNLRDRQFLKADTVAEMGQLISAGMLMYGGLSFNSGNDGIFVEVWLNVVEVASGRHLWGDVFTLRHYLGDNVRGIVELTPEFRDLFKQVADSVRDSLRQAPSLSGVKKVLIVPLAGDLDHYVTGHVRNAISATALLPVDLGVRSLAQARILAEAEGADKMPDAILVGAVRDLAQRLEKLSIGGEIWRSDVEVELQILDSQSNTVLWSDTISHSYREKVGQEEKVVTWLSESPKRLLYILGGLIVLLILWRSLVFIKKNMTRVR